jgi:energy-coupling factor transport system permease protein
MFRKGLNTEMKKLDPRTKLVVGVMAVAAVFIAVKPLTLVIQCAIVLLSLPMMGMSKTLMRSFRLVVSMIALVFVVTFITFGFRVAGFLSLRLFTLLTVSYVFFQSINPEELGGALRKMGLPFGMAFILTAAMRYVPLIGQKLRQIMDAQSSRGIDLRFRIKNMLNFMALLLPLLVQSFILSDELAMAMEARGFGREKRSSHIEYRLNAADLILMSGGLILLVIYAWWERG